jgi:hypothetical protein
MPIGDLVVKIGLSFLDTPYVAATLENGPAEKMVVNLRELDCTTFVESVLALARTVKLGKTDFETFVLELQKIRYRGGIRNKYPSRLHYFSDWILDGNRKGLIDDSINIKGERFVRNINYMSTHPDSYLALKEAPEMINEIASQEKELNNRNLCYFPKSNFNKLYKNLRNGDIIGLTSGVDGIDINHTGIIVKKDNEFYLLHGSQSHKKVVLSAEPITDFLKPASKNSGIMIARPVF